MLHTIASNHSNVVTLHRVIDSPEDPCVYVILDYCPDGDLFSMITEHQRYMVAQPESLASLEDAAMDAAEAAGLDPNQYIIDHADAIDARLAQDKARYKTERTSMDAMIKKVFCQIIDAVEFCHSYGIYHRDLKPENILCLSGGSKVVLADFGLATGEKASTDFGCGSTFYMGPECQGGITTRLTEYSTAANDMWSLGVILVNLTCGRNPWKQACTGDETFREYLRRPDFLLDILPISDEANEILKRIFTVRPEWRISTTDLRKMVLNARHFTVTDEQMKIREHQARVAASQARAAQRAAAAAKQQKAAAAEQYAAQQQLQHAQQRYYARQQQSLATQQLSIQKQHQEQQQQQDLRRVGNTDSGHWSGGSNESSSSGGYEVGFDSTSSVNTPASSAPTSPDVPVAISGETEDVNWAKHPISTAQKDGRVARRGLVEPSTPQRKNRQYAQEPDSPSSSFGCEPSLSGDSASSRRSSFSYTGLPPTPRTAPHPAFGSPVSRAGVISGSGHTHQKALDVNSRLDAMILKDKHGASPSPKLSIREILAQEAPVTLRAAPTSRRH
jgi:serine/threonine protein kinase